jgi:hypothetical protein
MNIPFSEPPIFRHMIHISSTADPAGPLSFPRHLRHCHAGRGPAGAPGRPFRVDLSPGLVIQGDLSQYL